MIWCMNTGRSFSVSANDLTCDLTFDAVNRLWQDTINASTLCIFIFQRCSQYVWLKQW